MARDYVRDKEAVQDLNKELIKGEEFINKQEGAAKKLLNTIGGISQELNKSGDFSEKNVKQADLLAGAGQASLKFAQSKSKKDKEAFDNIVKQYKTYRDLGGEQIKGFGNLVKQTNELGIQESLLDKIGISQESITEALKDQVPYGKQLAVLFNEKAGAAKKIAALLFIGSSILKGFAARTKVIGQEFGAIGMMNDKFKTDLLGASSNAMKLGLDTKDVAEVVKELSSNFGVGRDEALGMTNQILDTSVALGVSVSSTTKLIGNLTEIAGLSFESANNFSKQVGLLAQAEGAAPNAVLRDIAESSEEIAKFTGDTPDNLAKAAIHANKLGLKLKDITGTARGLLNFQDSLNAEIEASIMLGRDVNLQKARELSLAGDMEGLAVEITNQVGSQAEFEAMNVLQKESLAKALNMEVSQLAKVITNQDKIKTLQDAISDTKGFEELVGREGLDNITKITNDFKTIGATLVNTVGPAVSFVAGGLASFSGFLQESQGAMRLMIGLTTTLMTKSIATAIAGIFTSNSKIPGIGIALALGGVAAMMASISGAKNVALAEGGIVTSEINNATIGERGAEAVIPLAKLGGMLRDAMAPIAAENRKLREESNRQTAAIGKIGSQVAGSMIDMQMS